MASLAHEIRQHLDGEYLGWPIFVSREPIEPSDVITLYDTPGLGSDTDEQTMLRPRLQVRTRSRDYLAAMDVHAAIRVTLTTLQALPISDGVVIGLNDVSGPFSIGRDDNDRHIITANFEAVIDDGASAADDITWGDAPLSP